jgi:uncharacterized protein (TIGR04255 family)
MPASSPGPFGPEPVEEVRLTKAPLARVLAQVRFEQLSLFVKPEPVAPFVERLSSEYPLLKSAHELQVVVGPSEVSQQPSPAQLWQLRSQDSSWTVTVSNGSLAIETSRYDRRDAFVARFEAVIQAFTETLGAPPPTRLGIRYTNLINADTLDTDELAALIRRDAQGGLAIPVSPNAERRHSLNDILFVVEEDFIQARWGLLPEGTVLDPTWPPLSSRSWFLDLDSFTNRPGDMRAPVQARRARDLAERAYRLFRWLVTDDFIARFQ